MVCAPLASKPLFELNQSVCRGDVSVQKWTNAVATASRSLRSCSANQPRPIKLLIAAGESTISTITAPRRRRARHRRCRAAACEIVRDKGGYVPVTMQVEFFTLARDVIAGVCEGDSGEQEYDAVGVYPQPFTPRQSRPSDRGSSSVH